MQISSLGCRRRLDSGNFINGPSRGGGVSLPQRCRRGGTPPQAWTMWVEWECMIDVDDGAMLGAMLQP